MRNYKYFYLISKQEFAQEYHLATEFILNQIFKNINERAVSVRTGYVVFNINYGLRIK